MPLTVADFIGHIKRNNVARINRFDMIFTLPEGISDYLATIQSDQNPVSAERMMSLSCLGADIPSVSANTSDIAYGNYTRKVAYDRTNSDFHSSFILTGNYIEKKIFDAWKSIIFKEDSHRVEYYDNYVTNLSIECFDSANNLVYKFELLEAYPISVSGLRLDKTAQNTQMILDVQWAYFRVKGDETITIDGNGVVTPIQSTFVSPILTGLPDVPNKWYAKPEINDILKAVSRVRDQVKRGDISPVDALRMTQSLTREFNSLTGVETNDFNEVSKFLSDFGAGLPIQVPGIGRVPIKLPF